MKITVDNNDSHIIDRDSLWLELAVAAIHDQSIEINLNGEGPCAKSLGLYTLLDQACDRLDLPPDSVTISTCNLLETHDRYAVKIDPQMMYLESARRFAKQNNQPPKKFDRDFRNVGNFIGHGNQHRLYLASQLYSKHAGHVIQTYHFSREQDYHRPFVGLDTMLGDSYTWQDVSIALDFLCHCPLTIDQIDQYPILNPTTLNITKIYDKFFAELVNLTYFSGKTFYIDEKIWRPMIMRTPFVVQGPQNFLQNLRRLGFQTFDRWWDEGYSEDPQPSQNAGILSVVDTICRWSLADVEGVYKDMQPVLDHNFNRLMTIKPQDFLSLCTV